MFSRIFIERPRLAFVCSLILVLAGLMALRQLPIEEYPDVTPPSIVVFCTYPGASASEVEQTVAMPLETELNGLDDKLYYSSSCSNSGLYDCQITFKSGINDDIAMVNVQNALKRAESKLPQEVRNLGVNVIKRSNDILCMFVFMTDGTHYSPQELNNFCSTTVADTLVRIEGVSSTTIWGAQNYAMRIWLDPIRMAGMNVSVSEISAAVSSQNVQAAAGTIGTERSGEYLQYKLNVHGRLVTPEEFGDIIVRRDADGNLLRLKDIARVELGSSTYDNIAKFNGKQAVAVAVYRNNDANALATVKAVRAKLDEMAERFPEGVSYEVGYDPTRFISISMREIFETLILALAMVVLITYLFLQDWRATLVPTVAIPVSLLATFPFMKMLGITINVLSMFGLVLVIGSLVDDAIVVVENCQSLMQRERLDAKEAALKSMRQITGAIIATTLVTIACYMPLAFYGGMVGRIYIQFAITMCISLCWSTFVAMTLSPVLCSLILRPPREKPLAVFKPFNLILDGSKGIYLFLVRLLVHQGIVTLLLFAGIVAGIYFIAQKTPSSFLPTEDKGAVMCDVELAPGATLTRTEAAQDEFQRRVQGLPGVQNVMAVTGFSMMNGAGENCGLAFVSMDDWDERKTPETQLEPMKNMIQGTLSSVPAIKGLAFTPPAIMGLGISGGVTFSVCSDEGASPAELARVSNEFVGKVNALKESLYAMNTFSSNTAQLQLDIDREKAETLGLTASAIFYALQSQLASFYINDFNFKGNTFTVKMQSDARFRVSMDNIRDIMLTSASGESVPLSSICAIRYTVGPRRIQRFNKTSSASVQAQAAPGVSSGDLMRAIDALELPRGYHIEYDGMSYQERKNQGQIVVLMALAMVFAYLFLVAQYESWTIPVPVMLTVFTALLGAFIGLHLFHESLSIYAQLGLVMLIGLTGKNAILMVEFSKQERENGVGIYDAAVNGASLRYRAVLMTAWSFIFGVFPLVVARGAGAGSRNAIGIPTFCGMILATTLGIVMTPALYAVFQRLREGLKHLLGMKTAAEKKAAERKAAAQA